jgi:hypothetical protein
LNFFQLSKKFWILITNFIKFSNFDFNGQNIFELFLNGQKIFKNNSSIKKFKFQTVKKISNFSKLNFVLFRYN